MSEENTGAERTGKYSRSERFKQRIDIFCGGVIGLLCAGAIFDLLHLGFGVQQPKINGWRVGALVIIFSALPAFAGMCWILGRCFERPDFNSLPSSKFTWGIPAVAIIIMVLIGCLVQGHIQNI